jgi:sugar transferase (PEP-CTERM system associated)
VLYALAYLTYVGSTLSAPASAMAALFTVLLVMTRSAELGDPASVRRQVAVFGTLSVLSGLTGLVVLSIRVEPTIRLRNPFVPGERTAWLLLASSIVVPMVVAGWRWTTWRLGILSAARERLLIVGTGETAQQVCRWILTEHGPEYSVTGFVDEDDRRLGMLLAMGTRIQSDFDNLTSFGRRADRIIVALDEKRGKLPLRQLMELRLLGVEIEDATSFFERVSGKIAVETMLPSWLIFSEGFKTSSTRRLLKRAADLTHASLLLVLSSPVMALTALLIRFDSSGPVLYRQKRLGLNGQEFDVLKFRSMRQDAERDSGPTWAQANDPRVTRVGRVIRKLRIDELPQLFNVLRGEMSFVGPRPERAHFVRQLEETIPYYGLRMTARPGITGWAQVEYRYGASEEDALEKLKYDLYYIKNSNLLLDLWIVLKTIRVCVGGSGAR